MRKLLLTFYGDDFTGSTDALEQLTLAGVRAALFIAPPTPQQLSRFKNLQAVGVAGKTRSLTPEAMKRELKPAFRALKKLGARHVHYKVCSTFDSSPEIGSIGCVMDLAGEIFPASFIPLLVAAPALGRYTVFGNHFARFGIGSAGEIHRLDRHPSISRHPVTPMTEADLRVHLAKQTKKKIALFDITKISSPGRTMRIEFKKLLSQSPDVVLFDALDESHLKKIGALIDEFAVGKRPLFSVGSSGIEMALAANFGGRDNKAHTRKAKISKSLLTSAATNILVGSGSCSPVTSGQIARALKAGFAEVPMDAGKLATKDVGAEIVRATNEAVKFLQSGRSVVVHTTKRGSDALIAKKLKDRTAAVLGTALGKVLRGALARHAVRRICIAGGDTSSFAARALGIEALEMIAPLTPGAPLCRAFAPNSPCDKLEVVFKGGQVGAENYFETVKSGKT
ncbi:MAG TPA: four-carbon acid sugar kinase family protein [Candidatus Sulfotelmatobacter sp.]|nr:four-carbon acid sugar kinase family protein [Candidatus Sulfotelmatobacter sp.]